MNPRIISLDYSVPERFYSQEQVLEALGYEREVTRRLFENTQIRKRHFWVDPFALSYYQWQDLCDEYERGALELSCQSVENCLDQGRWNKTNIGCIVFASVSGYTCPSMSFPIAKRLELREDIVHSNLLGQGCQASAPAIRRAYDFTVATKRNSLAICTEICSASYYPSDEDDIENIVANGIFADASAAALIGYSDDPKYPEIIDFESYFSGPYIHLLGYRWQDGRLKVVLHRDVPKVMPGIIAEATSRLLGRHNLKVADIAYWIIHPGGVRVLENLEERLGLPREKTEPSWEVYRAFGNCSSATVGIIGKIVQREHPKGYGLLVTVGAGTAADLCLLYWR